MEYYAEIDDVRMRGLPAPSPSNPEIIAALGIAKDIIDNWCNQNFEKHDNVELVIDGNSGDRIVFGCRIRNVIALMIDNTSVPHDCIVNYKNAIGEIALIKGYRFKEGIANIKLTADTGFANVPTSIQEASAHIAAMILNRQLFSGRPEIAEFESESILDYSRRRFTPSQIKGIIEQDPYLFELLRPYRLTGVNV